MAKIEDFFFSKRVRINKKTEYDIHYHETYELYFLVDGKVKYFVDDKFFYLDSGDIIIVPKKVLHSTDSENCLHNERLLIGFYDTVIDEQVLKCLNDLCRDNVICVPQEKLPIIEDLFYKFSNEYNGNNPLKAEMLKHYLCELIICLYRYKTIPKSKKTQVDVAMQRVADYIYADFRESLSLKELSLKNSLSETYLSRRFKSEMGLSLKQYINYVRITKAKDLLKKPFDSVTDVAMLCGYNDSNYFAATFKKLTGLTPLKYAKQYN